MCRGQEGSVLIVALIMLALLSIIGFAITSTTRLDIRIASNEYVAKQNLYAAEASALELVQEIDNGDDDEVKWLGPASPEWLIDGSPGGTGQNNEAPAQPATGAGSWPYGDGFHRVNNEDFPPEILDISLWEGNYPNPLIRDSAFINNGEALAFHLGVSSGASLSGEAGAVSIWEYRVYGRSNLYRGTRNDGWAMVEIGYKVAQ